MATVTSRPFPVKESNLAVAIAFKNENLIADSILPYDDSLTSDKFKYLVHDMADGFTIPDTRVGIKSNPNTVEFSATELTGSVEPYGLSDFIPQSDIDNAVENYDPLNRAIEGLMDIVTLDRERRVAGILNDASNYATGYKQTLSGSSQFSDYTNSDPDKVINDALDAMVMRATAMVLPRPVYSVLKKHPKLVRAIKGQNGEGSLTIEELRQYFELQNVYLGDAWVNIARKGQAANLKRAWGNNIQLIHQNPKSANYTTFGFTARFGGRIVDAQQIKKVGLTGGVEVWAGEKVKETLCSPYLGYMIQNTVTL